MSKILYFLTPELEKVQMEFVNRKFLTIGLIANENQYVKYKKEKNRWVETTLRGFDQLAKIKGWIGSDEQTIKMLGL